MLPIKAEKRTPWKSKTVFNMVDLVDRSVDSLVKRWLLGIQAI